MTTNYLQRLGTDTTMNELWKNYGFILKYADGGDGDFKDKVGDVSLKGIYNIDLDISTGASYESDAMSGGLNSALKGSAGGIINKFFSFFGINAANNPLAQMAKDNVKQAIGKSIAESVKFYDSGNGRPRFTITTFFVPGLFGFKDYETLEKFASYATLPKPMATQALGFSQHIYAPSNRVASGIAPLEEKLFSLKLNNLLFIKGGLYITDFRRTYSNDRDENGKPIFCKADITLEYFRELYAEEFASKIIQWEFK